MKSSHRIVVIAAAVVLGGLSQSASARQETAMYRATLSTTWSAATHPMDFPPNPHFSGLVGATHDARVRFWRSGAEASPGMEAMAETGAKSLLLAEIASAVNDGTALSSISGGGISVSPGAVSVDFPADSNYPYVTLVSMLAPSPDWFVGVSALSLRNAEGWIRTVEMPMVMWDAGTDRGSSYTSANDDMDPPGLIAELTDPPFHLDPVIGLMRFERIDAAAIGSESVPSDALVLRSVHPNPANTSVEITIDTPQDATVKLGVYDVLGRTWYQEAAAQRGMRLVDVSDWTDGLYVVRVESRGDVKTRPFVIAH